MKTNNLQKHLAIFKQPFLNLILSGEKTIESRFSQNKIAPFCKVKKGDVIIMKESGGLVYGEFTAGEVISISAQSEPSENIYKAKEYSKEICSDADPDFWQKRKLANYATLIKITKLKHYKIPRHCYEKTSKDRRSWIILTNNKNKNENK